MPESKIIGDFPSCPDCGEIQTISQKAVEPLKESGKLPKDSFSRLETKIVPLEQPRLATVSVPCIVSHFDICASCGRQRCTRVEIINMPIQMAQPGPGQRRFPNGG